MVKLNGGRVGEVQEIGVGCGELLRVALPTGEELVVPDTVIDLTIDDTLLSGNQGRSTTGEGARPVETLDEVYERLATLAPGDYDRVRVEEAKKAGVRVGTLDSEVGKRRPVEQDEVPPQDSTAPFPEIEPWPEPVDGAQVLSDCSAVFSSYVVLLPGTADALALWAAQTHAVGAFEHTPRLNITSPDKRCGKSTARDVLALLVARPLPTENLTAAVLFRVIEQSRPTILADEYDSWLRSKEELRGLFNAGHKRGGQVFRCVGHRVQAFGVFAPVALFGLNELPGTMHDRAIVIKLARAKRGEVPVPFDSRHVAKEKELCRKLKRWAADNLGPLKACDPAMPDTAFNRVADNWRPLFAIAEMAGGDWPKRAANAFAKLTANDDLDAQGIGTRLLADIAAVFKSAGVDRLASANLAERLVDLEGHPWAEFGRAGGKLTPNQLAIQLRRFGIAPRVIRIGNATPRGYLLADFSEAFDRYLQIPAPSGCNITTADATACAAGTSDKGPSATEKPVLHPENDVNPCNDNVCCGVGAGTPQEPESERII